jgi:hypothetical protein
VLIGDLPQQLPQPGIRYLDAKASAIIHTLAYFSIFRHPLRQEELGKYLQFCPAPMEDSQDTLSNLVEMKLIECHEGFYFLANQQQLVGIRIERNQRAELWNRRIERSARLITQLPFVEGLALTGSLSKGTQDPDGDIDFLLLSRAGRVWTSHFFFVLLLKTFPNAAERLPCANFKLAADHLTVRVKSLFTATEILTLRPLTNKPLWKAFYRGNAWVAQFYPEWLPKESAAYENLEPCWLRMLVDRVLSGRFGDWFEGAVSRWLTGRMRREDERKSHGDTQQQRWLDRGEIGHSQQRQKAVRQAWEAALENFESRNSVRLVRWQWELGNRIEEIGSSTPNAGHHGHGLAE